MALKKGCSKILEKFLSDAWATPPSSPGTCYSELDLSPHTHGMRLSIESHEEFYNFSNLLSWPFVKATSRAESGTETKFQSTESSQQRSNAAMGDSHSRTSANNEHIPEMEILSESVNKCRKRNTSNCKRRQNKQKRMMGEDYIGFRKSENKIVQDVPRTCRVLKPSKCTRACEQGRLFSCKKFTDPKRENIFNNFWKNMTWQQKQKYVCSLVHVRTTKKNKGSRVKRLNCFTYFLKDGIDRRRVCKNMFLTTLGVNAWAVRSWLTSAPLSRRSPKKDNPNNTKTEFVKNFFSSLPKLPSHYCRSTSSKLYLEPLIETKAQLYSLYKKNAAESLMPVASRSWFENIFSTENLSLFRPKKDECDTCIAFKAGNISELDYNCHIQLKNSARLEKKNDTILAQSGDIHLIAVDLQAVKLCPKLNTSAAYYKTKLAVHNFTVYNIVTKEAVCYWFDETDADLRSSTFANFYVDYISSILRRDLKPVVVYSDGCTYQNRNSVVANALLRLAIEYNVVITQKFLVKGHTQMEVDSVHSVIERKLKNRQINLPSQYILATQESRRNPFPYTARQVNYTFFKDYDNKKYQIYESIRPGRKKGDNVVFDLRVLKYCPDVSISYKVSFESPFLKLPHRPKRKWDKSVPNALYKTRIPIKKSKYQHLQELKAVIPSDCHSFYDNLPFTP